MANLPAVFARTGGSKALGCLVYVVGTPFVALTFAIVLFLLMKSAFETLGVAEEKFKNAVLLAYPVAGLVSLVWALRDYRSRADYEVTIRWNRVEVQLGSSQQTVTFAEVESIRLEPSRLGMAVVLVPQQGKPLRLLPEIAAFYLVREAFDASLIPELLQHLDRRLAEGESIAIRESLPRSLLAILGGIARSLISILLIANPLHLAHAFALIRNGILMTRQGWRGIGSGFELDAQGLKPHSAAESERITWVEIERMSVDEVGLAIRSRDGRTLAVSALAENFWPVASWLAKKRSPFDGNG